MHMAPVELFFGLLSCVCTDGVGGKAASESPDSRSSSW